VAAAPPSAEGTGAAGSAEQATTRPTAEPARAVTGTEHERPSDKEIAREAWRKNLPDVSSDEAHASILVPLKGSADGATYRIGTKPMNVIVNLPQAESLITMRFYRIKRDGFRTLWLKHDDNEGTTLRLMMGEVSDPQVDIKDDYVRITIRKPAADTP
jgi:hypothetical protein